MVQKVVVTGAGGFIGHHLVKRLKEQGHWVRGVDIKHPEFEPSTADEFCILDLRESEAAETAVTLPGGFDRAYALAADMGGMGFISRYHAQIMRNNLLISANSVHAAAQSGVGEFLFTSSACIYPQEAQASTNVVALRENQAYPADPEDAYGWEKLTTERLVHYYHAEGLLPEVRIVRFHNVYGPLGTWRGGREKVPAALCRKIAVARARGGAVEIWGDGKQTRSFMNIDDCLEGIERIMACPALNDVPVNLGRDRIVPITELAEMISTLSGPEPVEFEYVDGPQGVRGRNSDNTLLLKETGWSPTISLEEGLVATYRWIESQARVANLL